LKGQKQLTNSFRKGYREADGICLLCPVTQPLTLTNYLNALTQAKHKQTLLFFSLYTPLFAPCFNLHFFPFYYNSSSPKVFIYKDIFVEMKKKRLKIRDGFEDCWLI